MEYHSDYFKEMETMPFLTAGMGLESIMESEIIQTDLTCDFRLFHRYDVC